MAKTIDGLTEDDNLIEQVLTQWYDDEESGTAIQEVWFLQNGEIRIEAIRKGAPNNFSLEYKDTLNKVRYIIDNALEDDWDEMNNVFEGYTDIPNT